MRSEYDGGYRVPSDRELTAELMAEMLFDYRSYHLERLFRLERAYEGDYKILHKLPKDKWKPDNRLVTNYAKQLTDTMGGYFLGIPVKVMSDDEAVTDFLAQWEAVNTSDDLDAELGKTSDIYGTAYELMWRDADAKPRSSVVPPTQCFLIRDDTVSGDILAAVRFWPDVNRFDNKPDAIRGTLYDSTYETPFEMQGWVKFGDPIAHGYPDVPIAEYVGNEERRGLYEGVLSLIDAHNEALSEKANDVDYYADAYLKVLGAKLDPDTLDTLRDSRIINLAGRDTEGLDVAFLAKPDSDGTQEHLLDRLEQLIFSLSMVADIDDEDFGTASGIAIRYRLQAMSDLAMTKERKFRRGMARRWRLVSGYAGSPISDDAWVGLSYKFTRNLPANLLEESQIADNLSGVTSERTQLSVLSIVDDPGKEIERKAEETDAQAQALTPPRVET